MFLLKEGAAVETALRERDEELTPYVVRAIDPEAPTLYVLTPDRKRPWWASYLAPHAAGGGDLNDLASAANAAVLLVAARGRLFALSFGYGRHLLDPEQIEQDFGLKVVLNRVAPDQLKSVDARTVDELTTHTRRDVSRDASLPAFGLDVSRDLLRAVTGTPRDTTLAPRLTGADALGFQSRAQIPELPALCATLLEAYEDTAYREHFDFIDHLRPERDPTRVRALQDLLVEALRSKEITDAHLAAPEVIDWLDVDGFLFSTQAADEELEVDPRISTYLASIEDESPVTVDDLRRDRLIPVRTTDGQAMSGWPVLRCLVYEVVLDDHLFILSADEWYRVSLSFKDKVDEEIDALADLNLPLPKADPGSTEAEYNEKAASATGTLCMDQKFVYDGGPDKMEVCDLLTIDGGLIHVKPRGSSSTLSHLFMQGVNSAERLLRDDEFRRQARALVKSIDAKFSEVLPSGRPRPEDHEISYVVITRSKRQTRLTLPFFSRVSLRSAAQRLDTLGFRVSVGAVREGD